MQRRFFKYILILSLGIFLNAAYSQTYPVQITTQLIAPYSGYLPDYADASSEKLKIILQFNDFSVAQYSVRLKLEIQGNGFSMISKSLYMPSPIVLQPGIPHQISGSDLAPYLSSNNLDFTGINQSSYEQNKSLPEGFYSICVSAYDYYNPSHIQISNKACANAWFTYSDPPFLNTPLCNSIVNPQIPQNLIFQWSPVNLGSPNSGFSTEYEFGLWELRPDSNANPNQIVLSTAPIYSTVTNLSIFNYGIIEPPLNLYMKYVWRVRARDISGKDWFKNKGYSQICTFTYGNAAGVLGDALKLNLSAQGISHRLGKCSWNTQSLYTNYLLQVRKKGNQYHWFDYPNTTGNEKVTNLEPDTEYEARVRGEGNGQVGEWSNIAEFKTLKEPVYNCNDQTLFEDPLQAGPLKPEKAIAGLIIQSGQFEVTATDIHQAGLPGWYRGKGYAKVFGGYRVNVKFNGIYIDDNNRHQQGIIEATTQGIDKWLEQWDVKMGEENATYVEGKIDSAYFENGKACVILQGNNKAQCFDMPKDANVIVIRDEEGNEYIFTPPKTITGPVNYFNFSKDSLSANDSCVVHFEALNNQVYGFDKKQYKEWSNNYEIIKLKSGKAYFVAYKSIGEDKSDEVLAKVNIKNFNPNKLQFKNESGKIINAVIEQNGMYKLNLSAENKNVYAWYDNKKVGKLNIQTIKELSKKLVLVPINNAGINITAAQLNNIYRQANVKWEVKTNPNFNFDLGTDGLEAADATVFKKYSPEMRALRDAYLKHDSTYDKEAYYVFVVDKFSKPDLQGYMPRGRALGFISISSSPSPLERAGEVLLAHELAHGAFGLEHTFPKIAQGSTNNLMDYTKNATALTNEQWQQIQSGKHLFNWFDEEEEAERSGFQVADNIIIFETLKQIKNCVNTNKQMSLSAIKAINVSPYKVEKTYLAGIQYDFISLFKEEGKTLISPNKNSIKTIKKDWYNAGTGETGQYTLINVNDAVYIQVPENRTDNMLYYLKNAETKNMILFVNGYRSNISPTFQEFPNTFNKVFNGDVYQYWAGIDAEFMNRIGTKKAIYADGHHGVVTANHLTQAGFLSSMTSSEKAAGTLAYLSLAQNPCFHNESCVILNTKKNTIGFETRKNNGTIAASDLIKKINTGEISFDKQNEELDIVAHSMGFAYAQGMIEHLRKEGIKIKRYYIIAPENACSGGVDAGSFDEIWQYGSNLGETDQDPIWEQDGVAPQCAVGNLDDRRAFIPKDWKPKGFVESHAVSNYKWIFNIKYGNKGFITQRK